MAAHTTREVAELLGIEEWRVRRLYELGVLPEPQRFANRRVIQGSDVPAIVDALRARGWIAATSSDPFELQGMSS